jgi:hypothetical protein
MEVLEITAAPSTSGQNGVPIEYQPLTTIFFFGINEAGKVSRDATKGRRLHQSQNAQPSNLGSGKYLGSQLPQCLWKEPDTADGIWRLLV